MRAYESSALYYIKYKMKSKKWFINNIAYNTYSFCLKTSLFNYD